MRSRSRARRLPPPSPRRRALNMLALSGVGMAVAWVGALVAGFADREAGLTFPLVIIGLLLGGSLCVAGVLHHVLYDEAEGKQIALIGAIASGIGLLACLTSLGLWFFWSPA